MKYNQEGRKGGAAQNVFTTPFDSCRPPQAQAPGENAHTKLKNEEKLSQENELPIL
jgi:hypothetical protein